MLSLSPGRSHQKIGAQSTANVWLFSVARQADVPLVPALVHQWLGVWRVRH